MPIFESSSDSDNETTPRVKLFARHRPMDAILGGGKVADVFLWRNTEVSAALLMGVTTIWFLFEVVEYNFVTLLGQICITTVLVLFICSISADYFGWSRPKIPELLSNENNLNEVVPVFRWRFNQFINKFFHVAGGNDPLNFFLLSPSVIVSLYIISVIGPYFDFVNLLFIGFVSMETLPYLYSRYENEVDYHVGKMMRKVSKMYKRFNSRVLNKIPRAPWKEKHLDDLRKPKSNFISQALHAYFAAYQSMQPFQTIITNKREKAENSLNFPLPEKGNRDRARGGKRRRTAVPATKVMFGVSDDEVSLLIGGEAFGGEAFGGGPFTKGERQRRREM
ncbi:reticulon-like protein B9 [Hibiscus syriacus]|uniref:reticulon-like protein B9 n=1 Tax=Hibiscus syriacus TaxID=106335 RepID=UPI001922BDC3|nr:reticulon-like protein B9 [Hibiscus syriacus]